MGWTRTGQDLLHQGPFLSLYRDSVIRPDGSPGTYEHVVTADSVRVVALNEAGQIALVEDDFYLQGDRVLHLPGGGSKEADHAQAALRELEEETGLIADEVRSLGSIDALPGITAARVHLFLATRLRAGHMNRDNTEIGMTVQWRELGEAVEAVRKGLIAESGSVAAILLAALPGTEN